MFIQLLEYKTASGLPSENLWEPSDSALRNSLRILGNLPKEYFYDTTLRLDPHFAPDTLSVSRNVGLGQVEFPKSMNEAKLVELGALCLDDQQI